MLKCIILGLVQGLTEFLPISSSGHLVILGNIFGLQGSELFITVFLHLATALALVVFFIKDIFRAMRDIRLLMLILTVTLITGLIAISAKDFFESFFSNPKSVAVFLFITGVILISTMAMRAGKRDIKKLKFMDALILGVTQGLAIIPGISRSGTTLSLLLFRNLDYEAAFKFSFLAAIPAIVGAAILEFKNFPAIKINKIDLSVAFMISFVTGLFSLFILKKIMIKRKFYLFGYYCIAIAVITFIFLK
ncbi:MAG: undecaprenyl-diphosphate phosphatase [Candidatus Omnitrophica bacterium]|nr:undecaprenyl-diphosphate phosphatase [Candidatus Omnitrophota bacterium]